MGRKQVAAQLLLHPPKDSCGVTAITIAQKIQLITHAGKEWRKKKKINMCINKPSLAQTLKILHSCSVHAPVVALTESLDLNFFFTN